MPKEEITQLPDGRLQFKNLETGEITVQALSAKNKERIEQGIQPRPTSYRTLTLQYVYRQNKNKVRILVPKDMDAYNLPDDYVHLQDDEEMKDCILLFLAEGFTLKQICAMEGFPTYLVVFNLLMADEEFRKKVDLARRIQAEQQKDKFEELIDTIVDDDTAKVAKAKADLLKHLMSVNDKERFGSSKVAEGVGAQITFVVNTGIQRIEANVVPVEGAVIDAETSSDRDGVLPAPAPAEDS